MWLLFAVACGRSIVSECVETHRTELADDEASAIGPSADDLMAVAGGTHEDTGQYQDGSTVAVAVAVARTEAAAVFVEQEIQTHEVPNGMLWGTTETMMEVVCPNRLDVPVSLAVDSEDGAVAFHPAATMSVDDESGADDIELQATLSAGDATGLPASTHDAPDTAFAQVWFSAGAMARGEVGWEGERQTADFDEAWAEYVLTWGE